LRHHNSQARIRLNIWLACRNLARIPGRKRSELPHHLGGFAR
jgi:hypothetical protein